MGLRQGPLRIRIEGPGAYKLGSRARAEGLVLAAPGEEADLVASAARPGLGAPRAGPGAPLEATRGAERTAPRGALSLSSRELEIVDYLADGWSNAEISSALGIGVRTVRFHLESLYSKLGVTRRGEAVREAVRLGLVRFDF